MTDSNGGPSSPKPWDLEQYRGVTPIAQRKKRWEEEAELVLGAGHQPAGAVRAAYDASGPSLFWLALRTSILTVITLGIYRFWMTTSLRRHYWNAMRIQGDPLEFTGTGLERLMGFLFAVIILAIYLGLVNILLTFVGLSYFSGNPFALQISILAALPLFFYATYRARRYILARTRWRGIRFGMDDGAIGYTLKALWYWFLTIATAGLLYPYQQFMLAKYLTDRSWFGDQQFRQNGSWVGLFAYWVWIYIVVGLMALAVWGGLADRGNPMTMMIAWAVFLFGYFALMIMIMRYEIVAFRYMWSNRSLGEASFKSDLAPGKIIGIYVVGSLLVFVCTIVTMAVILGAGGAAVAGALGASGIDLTNPDTLESLRSGDLAGSGPIIAASVLAYLISFAFFVAYTQIFITRPVLQRKVEAMVIDNAKALTRARQRAHDEAAEAGGFADALGVDVGAGI